MILDAVTVMLELWSALMLFTNTKHKEAYMADDTLSGVSCKKSTSIQILINFILLKQVPGLDVLNLEHILSLIRPEWWWHYSW